MTHYETLGVAKTASDAEIKTAYRKLAQQHHPDKEGGNEAKFKEIKAAFEAIETAEKRAAYDNPAQFRADFQQSGPGNMDDLLRAFHAAHAHAQRNAVPFVRLNITLEKAYSGTTVPLNLFGRSIAYKVRAGLPPGVAYVDEVPDGDRKRQLQVQLIIDGGRFKFRQQGSEDGMNFSGDLETDIEVDVLDLLTGGFTFTTDFLNQRLQVRIPSGFDPRLRLKVAGYGYSNWIGDKPGPRGDLYLRVIPQFKSIKDLDPDKVEQLYNATRKPSIDVKV